MKKRNVLAITLFVFGIILFSGNLYLTGAVVGYIDSSSNIISVLGLFLMVISVAIFFSNESLEEKSLYADIDAKAPVFLDTSYIVYACNDTARFREFVDFLKERKSQGSLVIAPRGIYREIRARPSPSEMKKLHIRVEALPQLAEVKDILQEYTSKMEDVLGIPLLAKWNERKTRYVDEAVRVIKGTSKYLRGKSKVNVGGEKGDIEILSGASMLMAFPEKYGDRSLREIKVLTRDIDLHEADRIYRELNPGRSSENKISAYNDIQSLLKNVGRNSLDEYSATRRKVKSA